MTTRALTRGESMSVSLGQKMHTGSVLLATSTPRGLANGLTWLAIVQHDMERLYGPAWYQEACLRGLLDSVTP